MFGRLSTLLTKLDYRVAVVGSLLLVTTPVRALGRGVASFDWEATAVVIAIAVDQLQAPTLSWGLSWLLYWVAIYFVLPRVYPGDAGATIAKHRSIRAGIVTTIIGVGVVVERSEFGPFYGSPLPEPTTGVLIAVLILGGILPLCLLAMIPSTRFLGRDGLIVSMLAYFLPIQDDATAETRGVTRWILIAGLISLTAFLLFWVTLLLVTATILALILFPLPEILGGVGIVLSIVSPNRTDQLRSDIDLETRLLSIARCGTYGLKGVFSVVLPVAGILLAAIASLGAMLGIATVVQESIHHELRIGQLVQTVIVLLSVAISAWYTLWYWFRIVDRLPHFLERWNELQPVSLETPAVSQPLRARPSGLLIQPALVFAILTVPFEYPRSLALLPALIVVCLWMLYAWRQTRRRDRSGTPQDPVTDNIAIPGAFLVQVSGFFGSGSILEQLLALLRDTATASPGFLFGVASVGGLIAGFYYADAIARPLMKDGQTVGFKQLVFGGWLLLLVAIQWGLMVALGLGLLFVILLFITHIFTSKT